MFCQLFLGLVVVWLVMNIITATLVLVHIIRGFAVSGPGPKIGIDLVEVGDDPGDLYAGVLFIVGFLLAWATMATCILLVLVFRMPVVRRYIKFNRGDNLSEEVEGDLDETCPLLKSVV